MIVTFLLTLALNLVFATFADSSFNTPKTSFAPNETVYFKLTSSSSGEREKRFDLLNEAKNEVFSLDVAVSGSNPYTYTSSFSAPQTSGIYYIDVKLDDGSGVTFAGQRNINVSEVTSENKVNVNINSSPSSNSVLSFYADKLEEPEGFVGVLVNRIKEFIEKNLPSWAHFW